MLPVVDLRLWWRRLLDPKLPGMADHAPRAKLWVMLLAVSGLAGLTLLRYNGLWRHESWAGLYMLLGTLWVAAGGGFCHAAGLLAPGAHGCLGALVGAAAARRLADAKCHSLCLL
jgi:hypothetical protein